MKKKISNRHYSNEWPNDLNDANSVNWPKAIEIIKARIEHRYFLPLEQIIKSDEDSIKYNCGFLIMSIDCLLIETLNQFYLGIYTSDEKYNRNNPDLNFRKNKHAFRDFFNYSSYFPDFKNNEPVINLFYNEIRCGLLHQAQTKTNSLINIRESQMINFIDPDNISNGIILNRNIFHSSLKKEFDKYLTDLAEPTSVNLYGENLRLKCNRKMLDLCQ